MKKQSDFYRSFRMLFFVIFILAFSLFYLHNPAEATDYFVTTSGAGSCTQGAPCNLQTAIGIAGDGDTIYVASGTYEGSGDNVIEITYSINLLGGWNGSSSGGVVRDPDTYITTLDGEDTRRVIHISGSGETPMIDGFTITNGNATGLITDCTGTGGSAPDGCGGGIFVYLADPVISNNVISNNYAATTSIGAYQGYGGGIYIRDSSSAQITDNEFNSNTGSSIYQGRGGAVYIDISDSGVSIINNNFNNNVASTVSTGWGGAIHIASSDPLIQGNTIENNQASTVASSSGSGIYLWYGSSTICNNLVVNNPRGVAVYLGHFGGIFEANRVLENPAHTAVNLINSDGSSATITNNIIEGTDTNTISFDSSGETLTATLKHNTIVGNGAQYGIYIQDYCEVYMWNNIIANHSTTGVHVDDFSTCIVTQDRNLFWGNTSSGETGINPVFGDPAFRDSSSSDYHIKRNSAAIDAGVNTGFTTDIDGDARPKGSGYDIGADEFCANTLSGIIMMLLN